MKHLKMAGLAAVAAMAFMAWLGAGTASAHLCTETPAGGAECPTTERVDAEHNSHIQAKLTEGRLFTIGETNNPLVQCTSGKMTATMTSGTTAKLETLHFENCHDPQPVIISLGKLHIERKAGTDEGIVKATETQVTVTVFSVSCTYGVTGANTVTLGTISGSTLTVNTTVKKTAGSFLCPSEAGWDTSGHLETPSNIYWIDAGTA